MGQVVFDLTDLVHFSSFFPGSYKCLFCICFGVCPFNFLYLSNGVLDEGGEFVNFQANLTGSLRFSMKHKSDFIPPLKILKYSSF